MKYRTEMAQDVIEFEQFTKLLEEEQVQSYLEIGARYGASLWRVACDVLPKGSRVVAVDLPKGFGGREDGQENLQACIDQLIADGYDASLVLGNSTDSDVVTRVRKMGKFDAVFIDGDHKFETVKADWINYGSLGRIVGFHDISWSRPKKHKGSRIEVPKLWAELKGKHRHVEFRECDHDNGIGVLWR